MNKEEIKKAADELIEEHIIANAKSEGINLTPEFIRQFQNFDEGIYNAIVTVKKQIEDLDQVYLSACHNDTVALKIVFRRELLKELESRIKN